MNSAGIESLGNGHYTISGELNVQSVPKLWRQANALIQEQEHESLSFDLQRVDHSDSVGLALLVDWMRLARRRKVDIEFHNLPEQMRAIANACGLDKILSA